MKLVRTYNHDIGTKWCDCIIECENCHRVEVDVYIPDSKDFWEQELPNMACDNCGFTTKNYKNK